MKDFLTSEQIITLKKKHRASLGRKQADRIKAILLLNKGLSYQQVADILMLDEITIRRYKWDFDKKGIDGLFEDRYQGGNGYLSKAQETELIEHLKTQTYQTAKAVCSYVSDKYLKTYSIDGMTHLLHRLGFVYKKTKALPGKVNLEKQEQFKATYYQLKSTKNPEDKIYFLDASHPQHNNMPFYG